MFFLEGNFEFIDLTNILQVHPHIPAINGPPPAVPPLPNIPPLPDLPPDMPPPPDVLLPPDVVPPLPVVPPPLPLARQPFNPNWTVHYMGKMDVACSDYGALHWKSEKLSQSSKFGMCCHSGKIKIPKLDDPPPELLDLLSSQEGIGKNFREHIRNYNNALAMTSLGCNQDRAINNGGGPYVFKVQGRLCHQTGSLLPQPGIPPVYAQLYIYEA